MPKLVIMCSEKFPSSVSGPEKVNDDVPLPFLSLCLDKAFKRSILSPRGFSDLFTA